MYFFDKRLEIRQVDCNDALFVFPTIVLSHEWWAFHFMRWCFLWRYHPVWARKAWKSIEEGKRRRKQGFCCQHDDAKPVDGLLLCGDCPRVRNC